MTFRRSRYLIDENGLYRLHLGFSAGRLLGRRSPYCGALKPAYQSDLEGYEFQLQLVNARELKQVPGRKSDVRDCQWIARLLHGPGTGSFSRRIQERCIVLSGGCPTCFPGKCACPPLLARERLPCWKSSMSMVGRR